MPVPTAFLTAPGGPRASKSARGGRRISTTHEALATTRLTPSRMATGEAAGTAAALACKAGITAAEVNASRLREMLYAQGAIV